MSKFKGMHKILITIFLIITLGLGTFFTMSCCLNQDNQDPMRTIKVGRQEIDYQAVLNEFQDSKTTTKDSLTTFEGYKTIKDTDLLPYDQVSYQGKHEISESQVKYHFSYDKTEHIVTLSAELKNEKGEVYLDEFSGAAFINEYGEIDAVMNVDGESILLSEMRQAGLIDNCGWFRSLIKAVVKVVVVAAITAAVVATTAAVMIATAGLAAPALVGASIGVMTSTAAVGVTAVVATGAVCASFGAAVIQAGIAFAEEIAEGVVHIYDKITQALLVIRVNKVEYKMQQINKQLAQSINPNRPEEIYHLTGDLRASKILSISEKTFELKEMAIFMAVFGCNSYTWKENDAYKVTKAASNGLEPAHDKVGHGDWCFPHFHRAKIGGRRAGHTHGFYGEPKCKWESLDKFAE